MTLDAFLRKYHLILTDEQKEDLINLVQFIQAEAREMGARSEHDFPRNDGGY